MDKSALLECLIREVTEQLGVLSRSAHSAHSAATHPDSKPENKYDTRGLEASYLAGAQSRRANEMAVLLKACRAIQLEAFGKYSQIGPTAVVELEHNQQLSYVFLIPQGGGMTLEHEEKKIRTITPESPMGRLLVGQMSGDEITVNGRTYEIKSVW